MKKWLTLVLVMVVYADQGCQTDPIVGCLKCDNNQSSLLLNVSSNKKVCYQNDGCVLVNSSGCSQCMSDYLLNNNKCHLLPGCITINTTNNDCSECDTNFNYQLNSSKRCQLPSINYCISQLDQQCSKCKYQYMDKLNSCNVYNCTLFNYQLWVCQQCNDNTLMHSSGLYCSDVVQYCIWYDYNGCKLCSKGYNLQDQNCKINTSFVIVWAKNKTQHVCIRNNESYNDNECQQRDGCRQNCNSCILGYYLWHHNCYPCTDQPKCAICNNQTCLGCQWGYYLSLESSCQTCATHNCEVCVNNNQFECLVCKVGYNLYQGKCYQCPSNQGYSVVKTSCQPCDNYCQNCDVTGCLWCQDGYVLDSTNDCSNEISYLDSDMLHQYFYKVLNGSVGLIYNNQSKLLSACSGLSNGYSCICDSTQNISSLCQNIPQQYINNTNFTSINSSQEINTQIMMTEGDDIRMQAEIPFLKQYNINNFSLTQPLSIPDFANYLQIKTFVQIKGQDKSEVAQIYRYVSNNMTDVFPKYQCTILQGNGYYFHFKPTGITCDISSAYLTTNQTHKQIVYVLFPRKFVVTGKIYFWFIQSTRLLQSTDSALTKLTIHQLYNPNPSSTYHLQDDKTILSGINSDGYFTIQVSPSDKTSPNYYQIVGQVSNLSNDPYYAQRIENIIYRESFIYILIFLLLYLILIPFCSIVDLVNKRVQHRKKINQDQITISNNSAPQSSNSEQVSNSQIIIKVNYRDFFPIYNIANTPRPQRLLKLCLFLLNLQHSITFLCLIYFRLPQGMIIVGVILGLPAYLCCIIMGYICGFLVRKLPGLLKYSINIIVVGYWIAWVLLMQSFMSVEYKPFIYIYFILFIILDLVVDMLQMLILYFVIKQEQQFYTIFQCLASWLTLRGYYEFQNLKNDDN